MARRGQARPGLAWLGEVWQGHQWCVLKHERVARRGEARRGMARQGKARHGNQWFNTLVRCMMNPFKPKDEITDAVNAAFKFIHQFKRGEVVSYKAIEDVTGFEKDSTHWPAFLTRFRKTILREPKLGYVLRAVSGVGYRILTHDEQIHERDIARQRKALRQLTRNVEEGRAVPDSELSGHQRVAKSKKLDRARHVRRQVNASVRIAHGENKPSNAGRPHARVPSPQRKTAKLAS